MSGANDRRGFLRGLATLPLIGGGVTLIGSPTAAAEPATEELLNSYEQWLFMERRLLCEELSPGRGRQRQHYVTMNGIGVDGFHFPNWPTRWQDLPQPSTRAAVVLAAVGCDWRASS